MNTNEFQRGIGSGVGPRLLLAALLVAATACASASAPYTSARARPNARSASCPLHVDLTTVHAEDVDGGATLVFATRTDVSLLRERVARMADRHLRRNLLGGLESRVDDAAASRDRQPLSVPSLARVENLGRGARIVFTPDDPAQLEALRTEVHARASRMSSPVCRPTPASVASADSVRRQ